MFLGAMPKQLCDQLARTVPFASWQDIYVCCSGSFRVDQAISKAAPGTRVHSNDVSLYSSVIGRLAGCEPFPITFIDRLAFVEELLTGKPFLDRCAAVMIAHEMSRYARQNAYALKHFEYYQGHFPEMLLRNAEKLSGLVQALSLSSYYCGDMNAHLDHAIARHEAGDTVGVGMFPPFFKGDYESQYKFLDACIEWPKPEYGLYDPKTLGDILTRLEEAGVPYFAVSDQTWPERSPKLEYIAGRKKPHFGYMSVGRSTVRHIFNKPAPFKYRAIDVSKLTAKSQVKIARAEAKHLNFLKDVYLAKGIIHSTGLMNFLIYIDGMLVGGIIYSLLKYGAKDRHGIYLLSDVTISNENKLSKLIATIATSRFIIREVEMKIVERIDWVITTARSKNPTSMKYRDIYELASRRPSTDPGEEGMNILQYHSLVREQTPQQLYDAWFQKVSAPPAQKEGRRRGRHLTQPAPG